MVRHTAARRASSSLACRPKCSQELPLCLVTSPSCVDDFFLLICRMAVQRQSVLYQGLVYQVGKTFQMTSPICQGNGRANKAKEVLHSELTETSRVVSRERVASSCSCGPSWASHGVLLQSAVFARLDVAFSKVWIAKCAWTLNLVRTVCVANRANREVPRAGEAQQSEHEKSDSKEKIFSVRIATTTSRG
ncbi:unnamed protein product [Lampetra fluviatilis]